MSLSLGGLLFVEFSFSVSYSPEGRDVEAESNPCPMDSAFRGRQPRMAMSECVMSSMVLVLWDSHTVQKQALFSENRDSGERFPKELKGQNPGYPGEGLKEVVASLGMTGVTNKQQETQHGWQRMKIGRVTGIDVRKRAERESWSRHAKVCVCVGTMRPQPCTKNTGSYSIP